MIERSKIQLFATLLSAAKNGEKQAKIARYKAMSSRLFTRMAEHMRIINRPTESIGT